VNPVNRGVEINANPVNRGAENILLASRLSCFGVPSNAIIAGNVEYGDDYAIEEWDFGS
jgi:hypothetical protein